MENVNPVSTNLIQNYQAAQVQNGNVTSPISNVDMAPQIANEIVSKDAADASKAYASQLIAQPERKVPEKKSIEEYKSYLVQQGKVEGKDFRVEIDDMMSKIEILENDKPVKILRYDKKGESKDDFEAYQEISYPISNNNDSVALKSIDTTYDPDGRFEFRIVRYEKGKSPYENEGVNFETSPANFVEQLKANNAKFAIDNTIENDRLTSKITVFNGEEVNRYDFEYNESGNIVNVGKRFFDSDGHKKYDIDYNQFETAFTEFEDSFKA